MFYICLIMCFVCCICIVSIVISPENSIALRWANLNKDRKIYGIMFYVLLILDIVSCFSFFKAQYSSFIFTIIHLVVCSGILFLTIGTWSILKSNELPNKIPCHQTNCQSKCEKLSDSDSITPDINIVANTTESPFNKWIDAWDEDIHKEQAQKSRMWRAKSVVFESINYDLNSGVALGHSHSKYYVTLESCTCPDFVERHKPCKHIYKLAEELGFISIDNELDAYQSSSSTLDHSEVSMPDYGVTFSVDVVRGDSKEEDIPTYHEVHIAREPFYGTEEELSARFDTYAKGKDLFYSVFPEQCYNAVLDVLSDKIPSDIHFDINQTERYDTMHIAGKTRKILCRFRYCWEGVEIEPIGGDREVIMSYDSDIARIPRKSVEQLENILQKIIASEMAQKNRKTKA